RRDAAIGGDRSRQEIADLRQQRFVVGEANEQAIRAAAKREAMRERELLAVLLHLLRAVQLGAKRRLLVRVLAGILVDRLSSAEPRTERTQSPEDLPSA